jgi:hypothetical protein
MATQWSYFIQLKEVHEMSQEACDIQDADAALATLSAGEDEAIPASVLARLIKPYRLILTICWSEAFQVWR